MALPIKLICIIIRINQLMYYLFLYFQRHKIFFHARRIFLIKQTNQYFRPAYSERPDASSSHDDIWGVIIHPVTHDQRGLSSHQIMWLFLDLLVIHFSGSVPLLAAYSPLITDVCRADWCQDLARGNCHIKQSSKNWIYIKGVELFIWLIC